MRAVVNAALEEGSRLAHTSLIAFHTVTPAHKTEDAPRYQQRV